MMSNAVKLPTKVRIVTMPISGFSSGTFTDQNVRHFDAPSSAAASSSSSGMFSMPARKMIVGSPTFCQLDASAIAGSAYVVSPSHGRVSESSPIDSRVELMIPHRGLSNNVHRKPQTMIDSVAGRNTIAR